MPDSTEKTFDVPADYGGGDRVDVYVADRLPKASRTKVQRSIKAGEITVNGAPTKKSYPVEPGDVIAVTLTPPPPIGAEPEDLPLDIVYEDADLLVVSKAAGMVVHPAYGHRSGTLVNALLYHVGGSAIEIEGDPEDEDLDDDEVGLSTASALPARAGDPAVRPGIVHRLDKDTSGLLVVAKHDVAHRRLAAQFAAHTTRRQYLALVWGVPQPASGTVKAPIGRDPRDRKRMAVVPEGKGKEAATHYETSERHAHTALLGFRLETGRTHQIRVHAQHLGHPVLGDPTYGGQTIRNGPNTKNRRAFFENLFQAMPRQALHAYTLGFTHPATGEAMNFTAPLPPDMQHVLARLRAVEGLEAA